MDKVSAEVTSAKLSLWPDSIAACMSFWKANDELSIFIVSVAGMSRIMTALISASTLSLGSWVIIFCMSKLREPLISSHSAPRDERARDESSLSGRIAENLTHRIDSTSATPVVTEYNAQTADILAFGLKWNTA